jgi:hypothetical protein
LRKALLANGCHHDMVVVGMLRDEWLARREELHEELDGDTILRFSGPGNERYDWPRGAMADNLVADLTARRQRREASGCAGIA